MLTSRNKPQWLISARREADELWKRQLELSDLVEMCRTREEAIPIDIELERINKECEKAEANYHKLYRVWDNYCARCVQLSYHEPIVAKVLYPIEIGQEVEWERN